MRREVARDLRAIFDEPDRQEKDRRLKLAVPKYEKTAPKLARWMESNAAEGLTVFSLSQSSGAASCAPQTCSSGSIRKSNVGPALLLYSKRTCPAPPGQCHTDGN
jgi:transposase-like protein